VKDEGADKRERNLAELDFPFSQRPAIDDGALISTDQ